MQHPDPVQPPLPDETVDNPYGKPDRCRACTLFREPGIVMGYGPENAQIMQVGEAPGAEEAQYLRPFIGGSGRVLTVLNAKAGIDRRETFVTNAVRCRPPDNRRPTQHECMCCAPFLINEIRSVNPNIIIALGDTPLSVLTDHHGIFRYRGIPIAGFEGRKVIATLHPAFVVRAQGYFQVPILDMQRARKESYTRELIRVETRYKHPADLTTDWPVVRDTARRVGFLSHDIETPKTLDPRQSPPICCGVGSEIGAASCFLWDDEFVRCYNEVSTDPSIEMVGQNSESFDVPYEEYWGTEFKGPRFDTLVAFHLVSSELDKDLETIASYYTDMLPWKHEKKGDLLLYNCKDVDATTRAYLELKKELASLDMTSLYYDHVMPVYPVFRRMSARGIRKDVDKAMRWSLGLKMLADKMEADLKQGLGRIDFDMNSPKQLMQLLYFEMGLPKKYKRTKDRGYVLTTEAKALEELAVETNNPILKHIVKIREVRKLDSTYISIDTDENDFLHPRFGVAKAANGRVNSWDPNGQNWPRDAREIIIPDEEDDIILSADWGQIEWRLGIVLSGDIRGMEMLRSGYDIHQAGAAEVLGRPIGEITPEQRDGQKFIVYGLAYGRGDESIAKDNNLPLSWVVDYSHRFSKTYPTFWQWRKNRVKFVERNYYLKNPWNRRRWWYSRQITEVYNFDASSCAADMMIDLLPQVESQLPRGATLRLTVHDELVINCKKDVAKDAALCVRTLMQQPWEKITNGGDYPDRVKQFYPTGWWCPADIHLGRNWKEAKKGNKDLEKELLG